MLLALLIFACSEKDNNPTDTNIYGYSLEQFITKLTVRNLVDPTVADTTDFRALFNYEIVGSDGWSPRQSSNAGYDLGWNIFKIGFLVPSDNRKTWFSDTSLPSAFKVKNAESVKLYRKVDVETGRAVNSIELKGLQLHSINNWSQTPEDAIKLSDLLQGVDSLTSVRLIAIDGYTMDYTPEQIADGYYLLNSEVTTFPTFNSEMDGSQKKFKKLLRMEVLGSLSQTFSFSLASHDLASLSFTIPQDLTGYEATILTGY